MNETLIDSFRHFVTSEQLFTPDDMLLLTVSGGIDSVVLCELCYSAGYKFIIAHCNFQLRGDESDKDEQFVQALAKKYAVGFLVKKFDTNAYAQAQKCSIQVAARELRYQWFNEIVSFSRIYEAANPQYIVTAHHADDNAETVLMNLFKGTGISGMRGILPKTGRLVRPLLFAQKKELVSFATKNGLVYREDSSNASDKYSRNYIRHNIIPAVAAIYPQASVNINKTITHFRDADVLYNQAIEHHKKKLLEFRNGEVYIPVLKLLQASPLHTIIFEIIKAYGFSSAQTDEVLKLLNSETGKFIVSPTHRVLKNRNWIIISPMQAKSDTIIVVDKESEVSFFENGRLSFSQKKYQENKSALPSAQNIALLDVKDIRFPLLLRRWKQGDYFYPLGMTKKKKIARFLIDRKMSLVEKEKVWVLEMNKKIIWVVNQRTDNRFKVNDKTTDILQIKFQPA
ncbi:MAG: tRNA lysidine(34) synthetase TilS [Sphingobacteriales bacterium 40-81]|nr:MAG: tRNA lysidine(34) synthetase TilS [Sphingobacteriales bacterium 40-81]